MYEFIDKEPKNKFKKGFVIACIVSLIPLLFYFISQKYNLNNFSFLNIFIWVAVLHFFICFGNTERRNSIFFQAQIEKVLKSRFTRGYLSGGILSVIIIFLIGRFVFGFY